MIKINLFTINPEVITNWLYSLLGPALVIVATIVGVATIVSMIRIIFRIRKKYNDGEVKYIREDVWALVGIVIGAVIATGAAAIGGMMISAGSGTPPEINTFSTLMHFMH